MNSSDFELRLGNQLRELAATNVAPIDPLAIAQDVVGGRRTGWSRRWSLDQAQIGRAVWVGVLVGALIVGLLAIVYVGTRNNSVNPTAPPTATTLAVVVATPSASVSASPSHTQSPSPAASFGPQRLALIQHGKLFFGDTNGLISVTGVGVPVVLDGDLSDFKAVRWSPDGSRLILATGQQPGDPLWHGLALADDLGNIQSWVAEAADFSWAPDSSHFVLLPLSPIENGHNQLPFYTGIDFFPTGSSGLQGANLSGIQDLGIGRPGYPGGVGWQNNNSPVVALSDVIAQGGGYVPDPQLTSSAWLSDLAAGGPAANVLSSHGQVQASVSNDGSKVAFVDRQALTVSPVDGSASCTVSLGTSGSAPDPLLPGIAWSQDGARIAVSIANDGNSFLWVVASDCSSADLIASGNYVFGDTYSYEVAGEPSQPPMSASGEFINGPIEWTHDGQTIYYTGLTADDNAHGGPPPDFDLRRISVNGGPSERVAHDVEYFDLGP